MKILSEYVSNEFCVKGSRFLAELFPCEEQSCAKELIKSQKIKYADSTHVVHAFVLGKNAEVMGMSDDGEPSGTAGRPALDVLKGFACTDTVLTIPPFMFFQKFLIWHFCFLSYFPFLLWSVTLVF